MEIRYRYGFMAFIFRRMEYHLKLCGDWDGRFSVAEKLLPLFGKRNLENGVDIYTAPYLAVIVIDKNKLRK